MRIFVVALCLIPLQAQSAWSEHPRPQSQIAQAPGQKLTGKELLAFLPGKTIARRARRAVRFDRDPPEAFESRFEFTVTLYFRNDGSWIRDCVVHAPSGTVPCGQANRVEKTNVGTWRVEGDRVCIIGARFQVTTCIDFYRQSSTKFVLRHSGVYEAMDGDWALK